VAVEWPGERVTTSDRTPPLLGAAGSSSTRRKHSTDADTRTVEDVMPFDRSALGAAGYSVSVDGPLEDGGYTVSATGQAG
jgi:hypothetical protein